MPHPFFSYLTGKFCRVNGQNASLHGNQFLKIFGKLFKKGVCNF